jgi:hypothetical protein
MKRLLAALALALPAAAQESCVTCHDGPEALLRDSAHPGLSCTDCHNGNGAGQTPEDAHDERLAFIGRPTPALLGRMCAECHAKEAKAYGISPHLAGLATPRGGASCVDCHAAPENLSGHSLLTGKSPGSPTDRAAVAAACARCHADADRMSRAGSRADSHALWKSSVHGIAREGGDGGAPTCTSCHRPHEAHRASDPASGTHPANQPEMCGRCHANEQKMKDHNRRWDVVDLFRRSPHARSLASGAPSCTGCHGGLTAAAPAPAEIRASCARCHEGPASELERGPHGSAVVVDEASATESPVHCAHCHDSHGVPRPEGDGVANACAACHKPGSHELDEARGYAAASGAMRAKLTSLHRLVSAARVRGHDVEARCEALAALESRWHEHAALVHGVTPAACERARGRFDAEAKELEQRLAPMAGAERPRAWLTGMWVFMGAGIVLMFMKSRRISGGEGGTTDLKG